MYIRHIKIKNFRSIEDIGIDCEKMAVLCGANSVGKSNIFRGLEFAFKKNITELDVINNLSHNKKNSSVQIQVDLIFKNASKKVRDIIGSPAGREIKYIFRVTKKGT